MSAEHEFSAFAARAAHGPRPCILGNGGVSAFSFLLSLFRAYRGLRFSPVRRSVSSFINFRPPASQILLADFAWSRLRFRRHQAEQTICSGTFGRNRSPHIGHIRLTWPSVNRLIRTATTASRLPILSTYYITKFGESQGKNELIQVLTRFRPPNSPSRPGCSHAPAPTGFKKIWGRAPFPMPGPIHTDQSARCWPAPLSRVDG